MVHAVASWLALLQLPRSAAVTEQPPLDLDIFEDDDCVELPGSDGFLMLLTDFAEDLEQVLLSEDRDSAWAALDAQLTEERLRLMSQMATGILSRPYCEPAKLAWMAAECLLVLRSMPPEVAVPTQLECARGIGEDLLREISPLGHPFSTRYHLLLRSPWPAFRLLDLLVRLHPQTGSTRMGACTAYRNWQMEPDVFNWPVFLPLVQTVADFLVVKPSFLDLRPEDGPLSHQYRARWVRVNSKVPRMKEALGFSDDVFDQYKQNHYQAGCHLGLISSYTLQVIVGHLRDVQARLQRTLASVAQLINLHAPLEHVCKTDWPLFRLLDILAQLQRAPPASTWRGVHTGEVSAGPAAAVKLVEGVGQALRKEKADSVAYLTGCWGHYAGRVAPVMRRWTELGMKAPFLVLAHDSGCLKQCKAAAESTRLVRCVSAPQQMGVEVMVAKYLALAEMSRRGVVAVWLDLDVYVVADPEAAIREGLQKADRPELIFAQHLLSESVVPAVIVARGTPESTALLLGYAGWLRENPYLLDHQGWDPYIHNLEGDFGGVFDYKGRNYTYKAADNGPSYSFVSKFGLAVPGSRYATLGPEFGSGDGWVSPQGLEGLRLFHFWGARETQDELFDLFYPYSKTGFNAAAMKIVDDYRRRPTGLPHVSALIGSGGPMSRGAGGKPLHFVAVSYAHGCCAQSLKRNRKEALAVGLDEARSYGWSDLDPAWVARNSRVLVQQRGAGWWLWKPHLILKTLKDPAVPWHRGVVLWVDAGNYLHADPKALLTAALRESDVVAMRLKSCIEEDWTSSGTLQKMGMAKRYALAARPQLGAYFLAFRKTEQSIYFVEEWLRWCEDPEILLGLEHQQLATEDEGKRPEGLETLLEEQEIPSFQKHQADQSVFSLLFKEYGFKAISLLEGHKAVTLARWRE